MQALSARTLLLETGGKYDPVEVEKTLSDFGFERVDYVYEPGQFAVRGSIVDVFSFSSEYPYRVDFFGDEVDSIRTFEVDSQLSKEKKDRIAIVPELTGGGAGEVQLLDFLPEGSMLWIKDFHWACEKVESVHGEAVSPQAAVALAEEAEEQPRAARAKRSYVNLDTVSANFREGEKVDLAALQAKGLVDKKATAYKVLARGSLDKSLTIEANDFSLPAVKMIALTGGRVVKIRKA